jgi:hypothetical protein
MKLNALAKTYSKTLSRKQIFTEGLQEIGFWMGTELYKSL